MKSPVEAAYTQAEFVEESTTKPTAIAVAMPVEGTNTIEPHPVELAPHRPWIARIIIAVIYLIANMCFAIVAFTTVATGYPLSIGLLPLACLGIVVFQLFMLSVQVLAHVDISLANMVRPPGDAKLYANKSIQSGISAQVQGSKWQRLCFISPTTVVVSLYFLTLKMILAMFGFAAVGLWLGMPIAALVTWGDVHLFTNGFTYESNPEGYVATAVGCFVVGMVLTPIMTTLSYKMTKWACSQKDSHQHNQRHAAATYMSSPANHA